MNEKNGQIFRSINFYNLLQSLSISVRVVRLQIRIQVERNPFKRKGKERKTNDLWKKRLDFSRIIKIVNVKKKKTSFFFTSFTTVFLVK